MIEAAVGIDLFNDIAVTRHYGESAGVYAQCARAGGTHHAAHQKEYAGAIALLSHEDVCIILMGQAPHVHGDLTIATGDIEQKKISTAGIGSEFSNLFNARLSLVNA